MQTQQYTGGVAVSAIWQAKPGEAEAVAAILARLGEAARTEPGVKLFLVHRGATDPEQFLFYELFEDEAAFAAHQQTAHFKTLVLEQGLPKLTKRERMQDPRCCESRLPKRLSGSGCTPSGPETCHCEERGGEAISPPGGRSLRCCAPRDDRRGAAAPVSVTMR